MPIEDCQRLTQELDRILAQLDRHCRVIAEELVKPELLDDVRIDAAVREINQASYDFNRFLPNVSRTRSAADTLMNKASEQAKHLSELEWTKLSARVHQTHGWFNSWQAVEQLVKDQIPPKRRKLFVESTQIDHMMKQQLSIYDDVFSMLHLVLNPIEQNESSINHGCFPDISLPNSEFLRHAHAAYRILLTLGRAGPSKFIDVGCGGGLKVITAAQIFGQASGLEFDSGYAEAARRLVEKSSLNNCTIIEGDGLSFRDYGDFDIVYFYRPMRNEEMLNRLEKKIMSCVRPGTLLIAPYAQFHYRHLDYGCAHIAGAVYIAAETQENADVLCRLAEYTGTSIPRRGPSLQSIWYPILEVSLSKGFGLTK